MKFKTTSRGVRLWAYVLFVLAANEIFWDLVTRAQKGLPLVVPYDMGVVVAELSTLLTGCVALSIANVLRNLENRLSKFEGTAPRSD